MMTKELMVDMLAVAGESVAYQPLAVLGWKYHEPTSRSSKTYWTRDGSQEHFTTVAVADALGIEVKVLDAWENATDLEAETECRAEGEGW